MCDQWNAMESRAVYRNTFYNVHTKKLISRNAAQINALLRHIAHSYYIHMSLLSNNH